MCIRKLTEHAVSLQAISVNYRVLHGNETPTLALVSAIQVLAAKKCNSNVKI